MHACHILLYLETRLDVDYWILREQLAQFPLGIVQRPVTSDVSGDRCFNIASVTMELLSIDHELIITEVAADDHIAALDEGTDCVVAEGVTLDELELELGR